MAQRMKRTGDDLQRPYLVERYGWLVRMRWVAVAGALAVAALVPAEGIARLPIVLTALALGLANAVFAVRLRRDTLGGTTAQVQDAVFHQLLADIGALALILHFSGGGENPFAMLYPLPMALGATLLRTGQAVTLGLVGTLCQTLVVLGELWGLVPHHSIDAEVGLPGVANPLFSTPELVAGYLVAFAVMNFGVVYFARSVTVRLHQAEALRREHDRVAQSRARLARIGELSAGVAHAVRNPVHGLVNAVSLLQTRHGTDAASRETLALMAEALTRVESVTRRLLALGRDARLQLAPCDVDTLVEDALRLASPRGRGSAARLDFVRGGPGVAAVDSGQLGEALTNVVDNAVDACRAGGRVVVQTSGDATEVSIEVVDDGPGVPAEHLPQLFDPFFTTKPVGEGTGLGLAIARRIIEEHGGRISVESAVGKGTTVRLQVPRKPLSEGTQA